MAAAEPVPTPDLLARMEAVAVELAAIGGREILATLGSRLAVSKDRAEAVIDSAMINWSATLGAVRFGSAFRARFC